MLVDERVGGEKLRDAFRATDAAMRIGMFVLMTVAAAPVQALAVKLKAPAARVIPLVYHRIACRLIGVRIEARGQMVEEGPVLLVANHTSWLDIPVLSTLGRLSFVAKREVGEWPFFGMLARLQRTIFIERGKRSDTGRQRDGILERLAAGDALVLFPEGTSGDGNRVLPFNSALFSVAEQEIEGGLPVLVQPVSVAYCGLDGLPMSRRDRPRFAWYGDMSLLPHLWGVFLAGSADVVVHFHPPLTAHALAGRKALARVCHRLVADGVTAALAGRPELAGPVHTGAGPTVEEPESHVAPAGIG